MVARENRRGRTAREDERRVTRARAGEPDAASARVVTVSEEGGARGRTRGGVRARAASPLMGRENAGVGANFEFRLMTRSKSVGWHRRAAPRARLNGPPRRAAPSSSAPRPGSVSAPLSPRTSRSGPTRVRGAPPRRASRYLRPRRPRRRRRPPRSRSRASPSPPPPRRRDVRASALYDPTYATSAAGRGAADVRAWLPSAQRFPRPADVLRRGWISVLDRPTPRTWTSSGGVEPCRRGVRPRVLVEPRHLWPQSYGVGRAPGSPPTRPRARTYTPGPEPRRPRLRAGRGGVRANHRRRRRRRRRVPSELPGCEPACTATTCAGGHRLARGLGRGVAAPREPPRVHRARDVLHGGSIRRRRE